MDEISIINNNIINGILMDRYRMITHNRILMDINGILMDNS